MVRTRSVAIDANVIVRYLTGDDPVQSPAATELFRAASAGRVNLIIPTPILQEPCMCWRLSMTEHPIPSRPS